MSAAEGSVLAEATLSATSSRAIVEHLADVASARGDEVTTEVKVALDNKDVDDKVGAQKEECLLIAPAAKFCKALESSVLSKTEELENNIKRSIETLVKYNTLIFNKNLSESDIKALMDTKLMDELSKMIDITHITLGQEFTKEQIEEWVNLFFIFFGESLDVETVEKLLGKDFVDTHKHLMADESKALSEKEKLFEKEKLRSLLTNYFKELSLQNQQGNEAFVKQKLDAFNKGGGFSIQIEKPYTLQERLKKILDLFLLKTVIELYHLVALKKILQIKVQKLTNDFSKKFQSDFDVEQCFKMFIEFFETPQDYIKMINFIEEEFDSLFDDVSEEHLIALFHLFYQDNFVFQIVDGLKYINLSIVQFIQCHESRISRLAGNLLNMFDTMMRSLDLIMTLNLIEQPFKPAQRPELQNKEQINSLFLGYFLKYMQQFLKPPLQDTWEVSIALSKFAKDFLEKIKSDNFKLLVTEPGEHSQKISFTSLIPSHSFAKTSSIGDSNHKLKRSPEDREKAYKALKAERVKGITLDPYTLKPVASHLISYEFVPGAGFKTKVKRQWYWCARDPESYAVMLSKNPAILSMTISIPCIQVAMQVLSVLTEETDPNDRRIIIEDLLKRVWPYLVPSEMVLASMGFGLGMYALMHPRKSQNKVARSIVSFKNSILTFEYGLGTAITFLAITNPAAANSMNIWTFLKLCVLAPGGISLLLGLWNLLSPTTKRQWMPDNSNWYYLRAFLDGVSDVLVYSGLFHLVSVDLVKMFRWFTDNYNDLFPETWQKVTFEFVPLAAGGVAVILEYYSTIDEAVKCSILYLFGTTSGLKLAVVDLYSDKGVKQYLSNGFEIARGTFWPVTFLAAVGVILKFGPGFRELYRLNPEYLLVKQKIRITKDAEAQIVEGSEAALAERLKNAKYYLTENAYKDASRSLLTVDERKEMIEALTPGEDGLVDKRNIEMFIRGDGDFKSKTENNEVAASAQDPLLFSKKNFRGSHSPVASDSAIVFQPKQNKRVTCPRLTCPNLSSCTIL